MMISNLYCRDPRTDPRGIIRLMQMYIMYIMSISVFKKVMGDILRGLIRALARYYVQGDPGRNRNASTLLCIIEFKPLLQTEGTNTGGAS